MTSLAIREAFPEEFDEIYPLLLDLNVPHINREMFSRIFSPPWESPRKNCGYLISSDGQVQGFLGTLFCTRRVGGRNVQFCNMTSWIVRPEARSSSIALLLEVLRIPDQVVTNFTPSGTVAKLLGAMKFTEIQRNQRLIPAFPRGVISSSRCKVSWRASDISPLLDAENAQVLRDHDGIGCLHALMERKGETCYVILRTTSRGRLILLRPHYVSNAELFSELIGAQSFRMARAGNAVGLLVEESYLGGREISLSRSVPRDSRWFFRGDAVTADEIDTAYSEMVLLHG
jgi:hypothetical protein